MRLIHQNGKYIALSEYAEREIPKAAGFRWDPAARRWWTDRIEVAQRLAGYADADALAALRQVAEQTASAVEASRATDAAVDVPAPDGLSYLAFQRAGIAFALARTACLIADEPGLGKTIQTIGVINADPSIRSALVICPASLKINWAREMARWLTRPLTVGIANGQELPATDVVIINYDLLRRHRDALRARQWDILVVDESHYLKSPKAQRTTEVLGRWDRDATKRIAPIPARRKLYLTGTPILNRPIELWPVLHALQPAGLGKNWREYVTRYCAGTQTRWGWDVTGASNLGELQERLRSTIMVRRLKAEVLLELPAKRRQIIELPANGCGAVVAAERTAWEASESRLANLRARAELAKADDEESYATAVAALRAGAQAAFAEISKLRHATAVAKIPAVVEHVTETLESVQKLVVFAHHHDVVAGISAALTGAEVGHVILTGETALADRQAAVDRFQTDSACRVFVGSITAAGVGITLTAASHVIFSELDWVPGNISQAEDRTHRIGQRDAVLVQHLVLEGSLDATMARTLIAKQAVIDAALDNSQPAEREEPVIPSAEPAATESTTRRQIAEDAAKITDAERASIHAALRTLAGMCDGARAVDGAGFNKIDTAIGHSLAEASELTPRQAALGRRLVRKYHRQLENRK